MKYGIMIVCGLLIALIVLNYMLYRKTRNIKFVDTAYIYNNFKLKQELEVTYNEIKANRQKQLDSLYEVISVLQNSKSKDELIAFEKQYFNKKNNVIEEQENLRASYDTQIWNQLNTSVKEYGEANKIDLIMGANGEGSVMHGNSDMNISEGIVEYANKKYSGK